MRRSPERDGNPTGTRTWPLTELRCLQTSRVALRRRGPIAPVQTRTSPSPVYRGTRPSRSVPGMKAIFLQRPSGTSPLPVVTSSARIPGPIRRPRWPSTTHGRHISPPPARCCRSAPSPRGMRAGGIQTWPATYQNGYLTHSETTRYPVSTVSIPMAPAVGSSWVAGSPTAPQRFAPRASRETRRRTGSSTSASDARALCFDVAPAISVQTYWSGSVITVPAAPPATWQLLQAPPPFATT